MAWVSCSSAPTSRPTEPAPQEQAPAEPLVPVPAGSSYADLPLESIVPNPRQPRTVFDGDALDELVDSIREVGLLQPVVVRPLGDDTYELVMGERRWRASQLAGTGTIPAIVRPTEDHDLLRDALLENLHRAQLNPLEEAAAYQQLLEDFGCTQDELATRIKRSRPQISNTIRLLRLPPTVQRRVAAGVLSAGTRGRCWACRTRWARSGSRSASSPRASRSGRPRSSSRWGSASSRPRRPSAAPANPPSAPAGWPSP